MTATSISCGQSNSTTPKDKEHVALLFAELIVPVQLKQTIQDAADYYSLIGAGCF